MKRSCFSVLIFLILCYVKGVGQIMFDIEQLNDPEKNGPVVASRLKLHEVPEYKDSSIHTIYLKNGFKSFKFQNEKEWLAIKDTVEVDRIDIVYSKYPLRNGVYREIYPLLFGRIKALMQMDPILNDAEISWNKVLQTNCTDDKQVSKLFHGVAIHYKTKRELSTPQQEVPLAKSEIIGIEQKKLISEQNTLEDLQYSVDNIKSSYFISDSFKKVLDKLPLDEQIKNIKTFLEQGIANEPETDLKLATENDFIKYKKAVDDFLSKYPVRENVVKAVFDRHPEWKNCLVINDWTGSMYGHGAQVLSWHLANYEKSGIYSLTLFNDGDTKSSNEKKIGTTGGIYHEKADNILRLVKMFNYVMLKGGGGDGPENDIEGILEAMEHYEAYSEVILIADNNACVRDIGLADRIGKPVKVIICGYDKNRGINPDYVYLAKKTGGGIYTIEDDLEALDATLGADGEVTNLLDNRFKIYAKKCNGNTAWMYDETIYKEFKEALKNKRHVKQLVLENKGISRIPKKMYKMKRLQYLDLSGNNIDHISEDIKELEYLQFFDLSRNRLYELPSTLRNIHFIEHIDLSNNNFSTMPGSIVAMKFLLSLDLSHNQIGKLERNVSLRKLSSLNLSYNRIPEITYLFGNMKSLVTLDLSHNSIYNIDDALCRLTKLEVLDLSYNALTKLPAGIGKLRNLKVLNLSGNTISEEEKARIRKALPDTEINF